MKGLSRPLAIVLVALWPVTATSQSPREQLQQLVTQLQATPADNALRERIIKLGAELRPPPAIPEDARRWFIRGNTAFGDAKAVDDYARAAAFYETASSIAPWWGDPYFNLAKALELRQDYAGAIKALRLFVLSAPLAEDARKAQDYAYVLEERLDRQVKAERVQPRPEVIRPAVTATWRSERELQRSALELELKLTYNRPPAAYERCFTPSGRCTEDDDLDASSNWRPVDSPGRLTRVAFSLTDCKADEIAIFYPSSANEPEVGYCGVLSGPKLTDVQWVTAQGKPRVPVRIIFRGPARIEVTDCTQKNERCDRRRWVFE